MAKDFLFTSESVSEGHPDKMADQISDAVLDAILAEDPEGKVACETLLTKGVAIVAGELRTTARIDAENIVRKTIEKIGYTDPSFGFDARTCEVHTYLGRQSEDIARGVDLADGEIGAGDQGLMFGYATNETPELMPLPILLSHRLVGRQAEVRKTGVLPWLGPDAKSQVSVRYENKRPVSVEKVVVSTQHRADIGNRTIRDGVIAEIIEKIIPSEWRSHRIEYLINPAGRFMTGGPEGDTGLTGRKIIVDTYGGSCPHGGGAFSGKDPTKVDRSAAYAARYIAKNIVRAGLAGHCTVQLSYAIGVLEPTSLMVNVHSGARVHERQIEGAVRSLFKLTPKGMIEMLDLRRPIFQLTAAYGHFGREIPEFTWERTDRIEEILDFFRFKGEDLREPEIPLL